MYEYVYLFTFRIIYAGFFSYLLSLEAKSDVEDFVRSMLGNKVSKTFLRELYVRWQPHKESPGQRLLAGPERLTELVRTKKDDLVLFAQKGVKSDEKKVNMSKHKYVQVTITLWLCVLGCARTRPYFR